MSLPILADKQQVIAHLRGLADGSIKPRYNTLGICDELDIIFTLTWEQSQVYFKSWSEYSGKDCYPIMTSKDYFKHVNMWDFTTKYGKARARLCLHIADELEKEARLGDGE